MFGLSILEAACAAANLPELSWWQDGWTKGKSSRGIAAPRKHGANPGLLQALWSGLVLVWQSWQPGVVMRCPQPWCIQTWSAAETEVALSLVYPSISSIRFTFASWHERWFYLKLFPAISPFRNPWVFMCPVKGYSQHFGWKAFQLHTSWQVFEHVPFIILHRKGMSLPNTHCCLLFCSTPFQKLQAGSMQLLVMGRGPSCSTGAGLGWGAGIWCLLCSAPRLPEKRLVWSQGHCCCAVVGLLWKIIFTLCVCGGERGSFFSPDVAICGQITQSRVFWQKKLLQNLT